MASTERAPKGGVVSPLYFQFASNQAISGSHLIFNRFQTNLICQILAPDDFTLSNSAKLVYLGKRNHICLSFYHTPIFCSTFLWVKRLIRVELDSKVE